MDLYPFCYYRVQHIVSRLDQLIYHLIAHHILKFEIALELGSLNFTLRPLQLLFERVTRFQFYFGNIVFIEPFLKVELKGFHGHLGVIQNILLFLVAISNRHRILELHMILWQEAAILLFLGDIDFAQMLHMIATLL